MNKKLAVLMSVYKNDKLCFLEKSVTSILNQTHSDFVFYIQCDGPIDVECKNYLFSIEDSRVIIRERFENKGLAYSLNELLEIIIEKDYEFIARMDADDFCTLDRFEKQLNYLYNNLDVDCLGTWAVEIDENSNEYFRKKMPNTHEDCYKMFRIRDCLIHPSVMFRKSYFKKAGLYPLDTYFGEDTIMWAQGFSKGCVFANVPEFLFYFRLDKNFFERRKGWKHAKSIFKLRRKVNKLLDYGYEADVYAFLYAFAKLMPTPLLNLIYKTVR